MAKMRLISSQKGKDMKDNKNEVSRDGGRDDFFEWVGKYKLSVFVGCGAIVVPCLVLWVKNTGMDSDAFLGIVLIGFIGILALARIVWELSRCIKQELMFMGLVILVLLSIWLGKMILFR